MILSYVILNKSNRLILILKFSNQNRFCRKILEKTNPLILILYSKISKNDSIFAAQVVHIRYFILNMSKILHRVRFIVGIFFPWSLILLRLFYADFVRFILSTLYGVFYRHCTVYFTEIVRFTLLTLYGLFYRHCTVQFTDIVRCI